MDERGKLIVLAKIHIEFQTSNKVVTCLFYLDCVSGGNTSTL